MNNKKIKIKQQWYIDTFITPVTRMYFTRPVLSSPTTAMTDQLCQHQIHRTPSRALGQIIRDNLVREYLAMS